MTSIGGVEMVDWNLAVATATRLVRPGPEVSREEARAVVAELRRHAKSSEEHVRSFTRMAVSGGPASDTPVLVVDRAGWIKANVAGFRQILKPLLGKMQDRRGGLPGGAVLGAVGGKVTGVELGMLLSFLASRVLGQYETFAPATRELPGSPGGGRLLLVAPNIVHVERELDVAPHDFRLWVSLHEETHRTQFTAVPWLRDHIESEIQAFLGETDVDPATLLERVREAFQSLSGGRPGDERDEADGGGAPSIIELVPDPGPAGDPGPADRGDVAAGGARRLRHGRGGAGGSCLIRRGHHRLRTDAVVAAVEPGLARAGLAERLHPAAQAGGGQGRHQGEVGRLRHPQ
ncbi:hypothetical protein SANTM175S_07523 [Streptomyces antimycoticus]